MTINIKYNHNIKMFEFENVYPQKLPLDINLPENKGGLSKEEEELLNMNLEYIKKNTWLWDIKDKNYTFNLPPTIFQNKIVISTSYQYEGGNRVKYLNREDENRAPLREEHLTEIWRKGEFTVPSTVPELPYKWKLSLWTVKGIDNVKKSYVSNLATTFYLMYSMKYRFSCEYERFNLSFASSVYSIYESVYNTIELFIGFPSFYSNQDGIKQKVNHDNLISFIETNPLIKLKMYAFVFYRKVTENERQFWNEWEREAEKRRKEYRKQKMTENEINQRIRNESIEAYQNFLNTSPEYKEFNDVYDSNSFIQSQQIIFNHQLTKSENEKAQLNAFISSLDQYYIRNECYSWRNDQINNFTKKLQTRLQQEYLSNVERDISQYQIPSSILVNYRQCQEHFEQRCKEVEKTFPKEPRNKNRIRRICIRPYDIEEERNLNSTYYSFKKRSTIHINSSFPFWRIALYFVKFFIYWWNILVSLLWFMTYSCIGILALFCVEVYKDDSINSSTGEVTHCDRAYTFPRCVSNLCEWISDSREEFENSPDTGFFGKSFSRIFNLIYNYIFKFIIIGSLLIALYPSAILINVAICLALVICSPVLALIGLVFEWLFHLLIYDCLLEKSVICPLLRYVIWNLLIKGIFQFVLCILLFVIQPVLAVLMFIFANLRFVLREIYDFLMYYLVKCIAKIPVTDSCLAWKKAGPELFRNRFYDISDQDIILLVRGFLERKELDEYKRKTREVLDTANRSSDKIRLIFSKIGLNYNPNQKVADSVRFFERKLRETTEARENIYPSSRVDQVKFSKERLDWVKDLIKRYLLEYEKDFSLNTIIKFYHIEEKENVEDIIVNNLLRSLFGERIFQTLEENDEVVQLETKGDYQIDKVAKIIFEDPSYKGFHYVEKEKIKIQEPIIPLAQVARFKDVVIESSPLFIKLSLLTKNELRNYLGIESLYTVKEEEVIKT